ncbi:MAG: bacteriohemerythrin [Magnetospiraceae bacterium]
MITEESVLAALLDGAFEEAVFRWEKLARQRQYPFNGNANALALSAQLLEARLLYLSMVNRDQKILRMLSKYREWLLDQSSEVANGRGIGEIDLKMPASMRVGHPEIDAEHEELFDRANAIRNALRKGDREQGALLAAALLDAMLAHFDNEEEILYSEACPEAEIHAMYHNRLRDRAAEIRRDLRKFARDPETSITTFNTLVTFLINDPIAADQDLKPYFDSHVSNTYGVPTARR